MRNIFSRLLIFALLFGPLSLQADQAGQADQANRQPLFKIERSKNANIVQYDAVIGLDGNLDRKMPVEAYWVRLAEQGQKKDLSWLQKTFVYGFKADLDRKTGSVTLNMNSDLSPPIKVERVDGIYQAMMEIDGQSSRLVKVFIHATGKGMSTRLVYIEMYGTALETGEDVYQRFEP